MNDFTRRQFLQTLSMVGLSAAAVKAFPQEALRWIEDGGYADELTRTPHQTEGPFFPDRLPLDKDNDLVLISGRTTPAGGEVTHLTGRILDVKGNPVKDAVIEIWQVDAHGAYIHSGSMNRWRMDRNFQGYGRFETDAKGEYRFRTIKPIAYPGRPPHIHVKVSKADRELLTTQCYVKGDPRNDRDEILREIADPKARASLIVPFEPLKGSKAAELAANFNIVLGLTPAAD
jgi:protocatechuate 3,4-dioxygenase, beta subunit